jgi:hypothetical protein
MRWTFPGVSAPIGHARQELVARAILYPPSLRIIAVPTRRWPRKTYTGRTI